MTNYLSKTAGLALLTLLSAAAQPYPASLASNLLSDASGPFTDQKLGTIKYADVSGDGYPDLCFMDSIGIKCASYSPDSGTFGAPDLFTTEFNLANTAAESIWQTLQYGDLDGDGKADMCIRQPVGMVCLKSDGFQFFRFILIDATAFSDEQGFGNDRSYWRTIRLADVTGDGLLDLCGRSAGYILCQPLTRGSYGRWNFGVFNRWQAQFSDANGWNASEAYWGTIQFPDLNADGKADLCGRDRNGIACYLSDGSRFSTERISNTFFSDTNYWNQPQYSSTIQFADLNGDRTPDLCGRGVAGMYCSLSYGAYLGPTFQADRFFSDANGWNVNNRFSTIRLVDINGDGKADLCGRGSDGIRCGLVSPTIIGYGPGYAIPGAAFATPQLWINNFGDNYGWNSSESYWRTVQPLRNSLRQTAFCGRGNAGIWCSAYR